MTGDTRHFKGISVTAMPFHLYFPNEESVSWTTIEVSDPAHRSVVFPLLLVEFHTDPFSSRKYSRPDEFDLHQALSLNMGVELRASPVGSALANFDSEIEKQTPTQLTTPFFPPTITREPMLSSEPERDRIAMVLSTRS